jgi:hypothetical protein
MTSLEDRWHDLAPGLHRAWELARRIGDWPILTEAPTELSRHAKTELSPSQPQDGPALPMPADLAAKPAASATLRHAYWSRPTGFRYQRGFSTRLGNDRE